MTLVRRAVHDIKACADDLADAADTAAEALEDGPAKESLVKMEAVLSTFVAEIESVFAGYGDDNLLRFAEVVDIRNRKHVLEMHGGSVTAAKEAMREQLLWGLNSLHPLLAVPRLVVLPEEPAELSSDDEEVISASRRGGAGASASSSKASSGGGGGGGKRKGLWVGTRTDFWE